MTSRDIMKSRREVWYELGDKKKARPIIVQHEVHKARKRSWGRKIPNLYISSLHHGHQPKDRRIRRHILYYVGRKLYSPVRSIVQVPQGIKRLFQHLREKGLGAGAWRGIRGIIRRMGETWSAFWLVKFVASSKYRKAKIHSQHKDRVVLNLVDLYEEKTHKNRDRVKEIVRFAHAELPYLLEEYQRESDQSKMFRTTGDGRKLIWGGCWGLFVALVKENWLAVVAMFTIVGTVFFNGLPSLVKLIVNHWPW